MQNTNIDQILFRKDLAYCTPLPVVQGGPFVIVHKGKADNQDEEVDGWWGQG